MIPSRRLHASRPNAVPPVEVGGGRPAEPSPPTTGRPSRARSTAGELALPRARSVGTGLLRLATTLLAAQVAGVRAQAEAPETAEPPRRGYTTQFLATLPSLLIALGLAKTALDTANRLFGPLSRTDFMPARPAPEGARYPLTSPMLARYGGEHEWSLFTPFGPQVVYFPPARRALFQVAFTNGRLAYAGDATPVDTRDHATHHGGRGMGLYVMDPRDGAVYVFPEKLGRVHHSSMLDVDPAAAGKLHTDAAGTLLKVDRLCGHFRPSLLQLGQMLRELDARGVSGFDVAVGETPQENETRTWPVSRLPADVRAALGLDEAPPPAGAPHRKGAARGRKGRRFV